MTTAPIFLCAGCTRLRREPFQLNGIEWFACDAFPHGIPEAIIDGGDHRTPIGGETDGLVYEEADGWEGWEAKWRNLTGASP